jgi:hypothetical protein
LRRRGEPASPFWFLRGFHRKGRRDRKGKWGGRWAIQSHYSFLFSVFPEVFTGQSANIGKKTELKDNAGFKKDVGMKWTSFLEKYFLFPLRPLRLFF